MPLKSSARGKSRIDVDQVLRQRLVMAMATDTVTAASQADGVVELLVVAEDRVDGERLAQIPGVRVHLTSSNGLNQAISEGLAGLAGRATGPIAVLPGDLPSLTADELGVALAAASPHQVAVVADRQGTGTTLLTASTVGAVLPRYGPDSLRRHVADGAVRLEASVASGLRRDVDVIADLAGVTGPRTIAVLEEAGWIHMLCDAL